MFGSWLRIEVQVKKNRLEGRSFPWVFDDETGKMKILLKRRRLKRFDAKVKEEKEDVVEKNKV